MSCFSNSVHDRGVVNLGDSFDPPQSHAIEIHLDTQLLDMIRVSPRTVESEKLTITLLSWHYQVNPDFGKLGTFLLEEEDGFDQAAA